MSKHFHLLRTVAMWLMMEFIGVVTLVQKQPVAHEVYVQM